MTMPVAAHNDPGCRMLLRKSALPLTLSAIVTPLGDLLVVTDDEGHLHGCEFTDVEARLHRLLDRRLTRGGYTLAKGIAPGTIDTGFSCYFAGDLAAIDALPVRLTGSAFQNEVWQALRAIPPGAPLTYGMMAAGLGRSGSARAVGHANALNPFEIVVPCHRLIGASGDLTGYAGGLARKRWLLHHEQTFAPPA